jgi:hypothetical protein
MFINSIVCVLAAEKFPRFSAGKFWQVHRWTRTRVGARVPVGSATAVETKQAPTLPRESAKRDARLVGADGRAGAPRQADEATGRRLGIGRQISDDAIVSCDSGTVATWFARQMPVRRGQNVFAFRDAPDDGQRTALSSTFQRGKVRTILSGLSEALIGFLTLSIKNPPDTHLLLPVIPCGVNPDAPCFLPTDTVSAECISTTGRFVRVARLRDEYYSFLESPKEFVRNWKNASPSRADLFSFVQEVSDPKPKYEFHQEMDVAAVLSLSSYEHWWKKQINDKTRNMVRKAQKSGVESCEVGFDQDLARAIHVIYNDRIFQARARTRGVEPDEYNLVDLASRQGTHQRPSRQGRGNLHDRSHTAPAIWYRNVERDRRFQKAPRFRGSLGPSLFRAAKQKRCPLSEVGVSSRTQAANSRRMAHRPHPLAKRLDAASSQQTLSRGAVAQLAERRVYARIWKFDPFQLHYLCTLADCVRNGSKTKNPYSPEDTSSRVRGRTRRLIPAPSQVSFMHATRCSGNAYRLPASACATISSRKVRLARSALDR